MGSKSKNKSLRKRLLSDKERDRVKRKGRNYRRRISNEYWDDHAVWWERVNRKKKTYKKKEKKSKNRGMKPQTRS